MSELKITPEVLEFAKTVFPEIAIPEKEEEITADYFTAKKGEVFITNELHQKAVSSAVGKFKGSAETVLRRVIGEGAKDKKKDHDEYKDGFIHGRLLPRQPDPLFEE